MAELRDNKDRFITVLPPKCNVGKEASRGYDKLKNPDDLLVELVDLLSDIDDSESNIKLNSKSFISYDRRTRL